MQHIVHYHTKGDEHNHQHHTNQETGWYFWDETWSDRNGPYETEKEALKQLKIYVRDVLGVRN